MKNIPIGALARFMSKLALIPARGGSKRIPRKNIKIFDEKPIISYSITAALKSGLFQEVMVSTDDKEIGEVAKAFGASVPFFRSNNNANDHAGLFEVIEEVISCYRQQQKEFEYVCCILPTAPFVTDVKLKNAFEIFCQSDAAALLTVSRFHFPIQRALKIEEGKAVMFYPENYQTRSQDLVPAYHDAGQFYWIRSGLLDTLMGNLFHSAVTFEISEAESQDIDTMEDWTIAELKYRIINSQKPNP